MKVLVAGGAGFIGSHIAEFFSRKVTSSCGTLVYVTI